MTLQDIVLAVIVFIALVVWADVKAQEDQEEAAQPPAPPKPEPSEPQRGSGWAYLSPKDLDGWTPPDEPTVTRKDYEAFRKLVDDVFEAKEERDRGRKD